MRSRHDKAGRVSRHGHSLDEVPVDCGECGRRADLVGGDVVYPHRPDLSAKRFYRCPCGAYVGCHPGTLEPLGSPAGAVTRKARSDAHAHLDALTRAVDARAPGKGGARGRAYAWLAGQLGITPEDCHVGMMDAETARRVVDACVPHMRRMGVLPERR